MANCWYSILFLFLFSACSNTPDFPEVSEESYSGTLTFKLATIDKLPDYIAKKFDSLDKAGNISPLRKRALDFDNTVKKYNLSNFPFFFIELDSSKVYRAYTPEGQYAKIDTIKLENLIRNMQKVEMEIKGQIKGDLILCSEISAVTVKDGKTQWQ